MIIGKEKSIRKSISIISAAILTISAVLFAGCGGDSGNNPASSGDLTPPGEVYNLIAIPHNGSITLQWDNPYYGDCAGVAIRRDTLSAPASKEEGIEVYNGATSNYSDNGLQNSREYFYTIFTYDDSNNYSSGDSVSATPTVQVAVTFADTYLESRIRMETGIPSGDIYPEDLAELTELNLSNSSINDITGLEYCFNLFELDLSYNTVTGGIGVISSLTNLKLLYLGNTGINIVPDMSALFTLEELDLSSNNITVVTPLSGLVSLEYLNLYGLPIVDFSSLSSLVNLRNLVLESTGIMDLSVLPGLASLEILMLANNSISDISSLSGLANLRYLNIDSNSIDNIDGLSSLTNLTILGISGNPITDFSPISNLTTLTNLYCSNMGTALTDISFLVGLDNLRVITLKSNAITDISALSSLPLLESIGLYGNSIIDINPLTDITDPGYIGLSGNSVIDLTALVNNSGLGSGDMLHLIGNPLSVNSVNVQIPQLEARGVDVTY